MERRYDGRFPRDRQLLTFKGVKLFDKLGMLGCPKPNDRLIGLNPKKAQISW
jgi:hypothetical protein